MNRLFRLCSLVALVLSFSFAIAVGVAQQKGAAASKAPVKNPIVELADRVKATCKEVLADAEAERARIGAELVGQPIHWTITPGHDIHNPVFTNVPATAADPDQNRGITVGINEAALKSAPTEIDAKMDQWRQKKISDADTLDFLYNLASEACCYGYLCHWNSTDIAVINCWADYQSNLAFSQTLEAQNAESSAMAPPVSQAVANALTAKYVGILNQDRKALWTQAFPKMAAAHDRIDHARKHWGPELWKYYDFAKAKSSLPTDGHGRGMGTMRFQLDRVFTSLAKPAKDLNAIQMVEAYGVLHAPYLASMEDPINRAESLADWATSVSDATLQVFQGAPQVLAFGIGFEPNVDGLRGYKDQDEPALIYDATFLESIDPKTNAPMPGKIQPTTVDGNATYTLMIYGRKLPTKPGELKSLVGADSTIHYKAVGFLSDRKDKSISADLANLWIRAVSSISMGLQGPRKQNFEDLPSMLVQVQVGPGVMPGRKSFKINGAEGGWFLDQGTSKANLALLHEVNDNADGKFDAGMPNGRPPLEPAKVLHKSDYVVIEIKSESPVSAQTVSVVLGSGGSWSTFDGNYTVPAAAVAGEPGVFRTQRIKVVPYRDPLLDIENAKYREPETLYIAADEGDAIQARAADSRGFLYGEGLASAKVLADPAVSLWHMALARAALADGLLGEKDGLTTVPDWNTLAGKTAEQITNIIVTQALFKTRLQWVINPAYTYFIEQMYGAPLSKGNVVQNTQIKVGDHAAMLLLKDHFIELMQPIDQALSLVVTDDQKVAMMNSLASEITAPKSPIGFIEVDGPVLGNNGSGGVSVPVVQPTPLASFFGDLSFLGPPAVRPAMVRHALVQGFDKYKQSFDEALKHANEIKDNDIDGLLALTGSGFDLVVADLKPLLMKQKIDPTDGLPRWVPDIPGRDAITTLNMKFDEVQAQKAYAAIDKQVVLTVASLVPVFAPGGILKTVAALIMDGAFAAETAAVTIPDYFVKEQEYEFARGAALVLGPDRFYMADLQRTPAWTIALNVALIGLSVKGNTNELFATMAKISKQEAARTAAKVIFDNLKSGEGAIQASEDEMAAFLAYAAGAELREAEVGAKALTQQERDAEGLLQRLKTELESGPETATVAPASPSTEAPTAKAASREIVPIEEPIPDNLPLPRDPAPTVFTVPSKAGPWAGAIDGKPFVLGAPLSIDKSAFFNVFRLGKDKVIKIFKPRGARVEFYELGIPKEVLENMGAAEKAALIRKATRERIIAKVNEFWRGNRLAAKTVEDLKIPSLKVLEIVEGNEGAYLVQEILEKSFAPGKESFVVSDFIRQTLPSGETKLHTLTGPMEDAIVDLIQKMKSANVGFEDFKFDNIYLKNLSGKWEAGVLDVDRLARWGEFTETMNYTAELMEGPSKFLETAGGGNIKSTLGTGPAEVGNNARVTTLDEFWELTLERRGFVRWEDGHFVSGKMNVDKLKKVFPGLERKELLDLRNRVRVEPPAPPAFPPLLVLVHGGRQEPSLRYLIQAFWSAA